MTASLSSEFPIDDTVGAWVPHGRFVVKGAGGGPLAGLSFAAKDLYDVAGHVTGAGNPTWLLTHGPAVRNSPVIDRLLESGATLFGKVLTDELAYSILGENLHYGTPLNLRAPGRVPGGSSSGSAAAVAARLVDFALGTDTGGSTRVPASYCGLWGLRTTHGLLPAAGLVPLSPGYDTATWLAHDGFTFERVGQALLPASDFLPRRCVVWNDTWAQADALFQAPLQQARDVLVRQLRLDVETLPVAGDRGLEAWRQVYVGASASEAWQVHGEWITANAPRFAPGIAARFDGASRIGVQDAATSRVEAAAIRAQVRALIGDDGVALVPSASSPPPLRGAPEADVDALRARTMRITCVAGLAGLPQVSLPWSGPAGEPIGLSLVGPAGSDLALIRLARELAAGLAVV